MSYTPKLIVGVLFTLRPHKNVISLIKCPNGHDGKGNYCSECGTKLITTTNIEDTLENYFYNYEILTSGDYEAFYQVDDVLQEDISHSQANMTLFHIPTEEEIMKNVEINQDIENLFEILEKRVEIGIYYS